MERDRDRFDAKLAIHEDFAGNDDLDLLRERYRGSLIGTVGIGLFLITLAGCAHQFRRPSHSLQRSPLIFTRYDRRVQFYETMGRKAMEIAECVFAVGDDYGGGDDPPTKRVHLRHPDTGQYFTVQVRDFPRGQPDDLAIHGEDGSAFDKGINGSVDLDDRESAEKQRFDDYCRRYRLCDGQDSYKNPIPAKRVWYARHIDAVLAACKWKRNPRYASAPPRKRSTEFWGGTEAEQNRRIEQMALKAFSQIETHVKACELGTDDCDPEFISDWFLDPMALQGAGINVGPLTEVPPHLQGEVWRRVEALLEQGGVKTRITKVIAKSRKIGVPRKRTTDLPEDHWGGSAGKEADNIEQAAQTLARKITEEAIKCEAHSPDCDYELLSTVISDPVALGSAGLQVGPLFDLDAPIHTHEPIMERVRELLQHGAKPELWQTITDLVKRMSERK